MEKICIVLCISTLYLFPTSAMAADYPCNQSDEVLSQGRCWKDRNLGASQVGTSSTDTAAYGDLYQWGRAGDGHQVRSSVSTVIKSIEDAPWHSDFITTDSMPYDWRIPQNDSLWQGVNGTNNPCPKGFRLPTKAEFRTEMDSWSTKNAEGAFASPLKLVAAGYRYRSDGSLYNVASRGVYWTSTTDGSNASHLFFYSGFAAIDSDTRAFGFSVRCIKD